MSLSGGEKARRLQRALEYAGGTHRMDNVVEMLKAGDATLFENEGGVVVAEIQTYPLCKVAHFWLGAGELRACVDLEDEVLRWGIEQGCSAATIVGRPGWGRIGASRGWKPWHSTLIKPLEPMP